MAVAGIIVGILALILGIVLIATTHPIYVGLGCLFAGAAAALSMTSVRMTGRARRRRDREP